MLLSAYLRITLLVQFSYAYIDAYGQYKGHNYNFRLNTWVTINNIWVYDIFRRNFNEHYRLLSLRRRFVTPLLTVSHFLALYAFRTIINY